MVDFIVRWGLIFIVIFSWAGCQRTLADRYTEDKLVNIMFDAHTLGLVYNRQEVRTDSLKDDYFMILEQRYGLDRQEFQELVEGLILDAGLYDRVYNRMLQKAEELERKSMQDY